MTLFAMMICLALLATVAYFTFLLGGEALVWIINRAVRHVEERRAYPLRPSANR